MGALQAHRVWYAVLDPLEASVKITQKNGQLVIEVVKL